MKLSQEAKGPHRRTVKAGNVHTSYAGKDCRKEKGNNRSDSAIGSSLPAGHDHPGHSFTEFDEAEARILWAETGWAWKIRER